MPELNEAQKRFLANPFAAVATTLRADGSPHSTIVWVEERDGFVELNTAHGRAKPRHLRRDRSASRSSTAARRRTPAHATAA